MKLVEVDRAEARSWMEQSLGEGHHVSAAVLDACVLDEGRFLAAVPDDFERGRLDFAVGGVVSMRPAEEALGGFLDVECERGARCVVVEDEFMQSGDPAVELSREPLAFVGGRVVRWCDLRCGGIECARAVHRGSSGYPLNAFVGRRTASELGLEDRQEASMDLPRSIVDDLVAVLASAFDAESFLIWTADRLVG